MKHCFRVVLIVVFWLSVNPATATVVRADKATDDFNVGVSLYRSQRFETASDTFATFLKDFPEHPRANMARMYYALSLSSLEQYAPARELFASFLKADPNGQSSADARYRLAECSYYLGDHSTAIEQFRAYLKQHPGHTLNSWASLFLGDALVLTQQWEQAEQQLSPLLAATVPDAIRIDATLSHGRALEGLNRRPEALTQFQKVTTSADATAAARAWNRIGGILATDGKFKDAAAAYEQLLTKYPQSPLVPGATLSAGICLFKNGDFEPALLRLRAVPRSSPGAAQAVMMSALALKELGRVDEARKEFSEALTAAGNTPLATDILFQQAQLERSAKNLPTAAQIFEDIVDRWPQDNRAAECLFNATELQLEAGQREKAERLWMRLSREFPEAARGAREQVLLGRLLLVAGQPDKAIETLTKVVGDPASSTDRVVVVGRYYLAKACYDAGKHEQVVAQAQKLAEALAKEEHADLRGALALAALSSLELKRYDDVLTFSESYLAKPGDAEQTGDVTAARSVALSRSNRAAEAVTLLKSLATSAPDDPQTWSAVLQAADAALEGRSLQEAETLFSLAAASSQAATVREPGLMGVAWSQFENRQFAVADASFQTFLKEFSASTDAAQARYMQARCIEELGDREKSVAAWKSVFEELTRDQPAAPAGAEATGAPRYAFDAGRQAARGLQQLKQFDDADQMWDRLLRQFPNAKDSDRLLDEWAWMHASENRFDRADAIHRRLLEEFPDSPFAGQARLSLAETQLTNGVLDVAEREFEAIVANASYGAADKERALFHLVELHVAASRWQQANDSAARFLSAYAASPLTPQAKMLAGDATLKLNDASQAMIILDPLRKDIVAGTIPAEDWADRVWVLLAEAALGQKEYDRIDALEQELAQRSPASLFAFQLNYVQGRRWKQQAPPDFDKARLYFAKVTTDEQARGTETAARCQFLIAETLMMQSQLEEAVKEYFKVYLNHSFDDLRAQALFQVAASEAQLNKTSAAVRDFKELIATFPQSQFAAMAAEELKKLEPSITNP